jgi:phosphoribosylformimino-5-aminoimidazole carboxamide ribotide isomerase
MKDDMFYKAHPLIFKKAEELRNNPTETEELLWNYLRRRQLGVKFRRQHPAAIYVLDFYSHSIKLAVEIDGSVHSLEEIKKNDIARQTYLAENGIFFLRFSNQQVKHDLEKVISIISQKIKELSGSVRHFPGPPLGAGGLGLIIIPAIDIIEGKCVRLTQGDYEQKKIYNENPLEVAKQFENAGLLRLHLVDLDGAKEKKVKNWKVLETIASKTSLVIDFGGGIASENDVKIVFESGAALATVGSIAVKNEMEFVKWLMIFGADKFLLGADVKDKMIAIHGWLETTDRSVFDFIENYIGKGVQQIFCTDISKDGKLEGPSTELYKEIITKFPDLYFIASGGVATINNLVELRAIGCKAAIVGKAIYENKIRLSEIENFNIKK